MSSGSGRQANFQDDSPPSVTGGQPNRGAALVVCGSGRMEGLGNAAPFTDELKVARPAQRARSSAFLDCWNGGHDLIWRRRRLRQSISSLALKRLHRQGRARRSGWLLGACFGGAFRWPRHPAAFAAARKVLSLRECSGANSSATLCWPFKLPSPRASPQSSPWFSNTRLADRQLLRIQLRPLRPPAVAVALIVRSDS
jgi:hypothetical protein